MTTTIKTLRARQRHVGVRQDGLPLSPLAVILTLQTLLGVLTLHNTAFLDEALYIDAGTQLGRALAGGPPARENFAAYFSGHPYLYPLLAGFLNAYGGLETVRCFSTVCMMVVTICVYWITSRCFNHTSAVAASLLFALQGPTLFLSRLATFDALCLALLAVAMVLAVQVSTARDPVAAVAVGPVLLLAVGVKYAALLFVPAIIALMVLRTAVYQGWPRAGLHMSLTLGAMGAIVLLLYKVINEDFLSGMLLTTTNRSAIIITKSSPLTLLGIVLTLGGLLWLLGFIGLLLTGKAERPFMLGLVVASLLAPAYHLYIGESVSLHKHVDFGLFFIAPLAGYAVSSLTGELGPVRLDHRWVAGVILSLIVFISGMSQAQWYFRTWPNSSNLTTAMRTQVHPATGRYLCEDAEVERYALEDVTSPEQYTGLSYFEYTDSQQQHLTGQAAYTAAIAEGHFDLIELSFGQFSSLDNALLPAIQGNHQYHLIAKIPYSDSYGSGYYYIWRKQLQADTWPRGDA